MDIKKKLFLIISLVYIFTILFIKWIIIDSLSFFAGIISQDGTILPKTELIIYVLFVSFSIFVLILLYLLFFTKLFRNKENRTILFWVIAEIATTFVIWITKEISLRGVNNAFCYVNSIQLVLAGIISFMILKHKKLDTKEKWFWLILSYGFIYLAIDEFFEVHEKLGNIILQQLLLGTKLGTFIIVQFNYTDDLILLLYFIFGLFVLIWFRDYLLVYFKIYKKALLFFIAATLFMVLQIFCEAKEYALMEEVMEIFSSLSFVLGALLFYKRIEDIKK